MSVRGEGWLSVDEDTLLSGVSKGVADEEWMRRRSFERRILLVSLSSLLQNIKEAI